ncbi:nucleotide disphospho-sugar-binding domain-containing protein [Streptomyces sp. NPDC057257]|uniref:nucleotide disphospho-sugar-binding domain-containing protein n=1 Tax=Streptomyces sp. NPDC057257 TaxID=3346071 RepID=UPI00362D4D86
MTRAARVLFVTWAAPGHLFPMVPLAWALQAAGHDVAVAGLPSCQEAITGAGLHAVQVGAAAALARLPKRPELAAWGRPARWPEGWSADLDLLDADRRRVVRALYEKQCEVGDLMLDDLVAYGRWWRPDLVVHDALAMAGPVLAAVLGVPAVGHGWEVGATLHEPTADRNDEPLPAYLRLFERRGVAPAAPLAWIDPCPPALRPPDHPEVRRLPMECVPYNGPGHHPEWLAAPRERPRVCLTAGVAGARYRDPDGPDVVSLTLEALAATDAEIVLAAGGPADSLPEFPDRPDRVRVVRGVPFRMLLPTCDLMVHHGGAGTVLTSAVLGVPQIVAPPSPICAEIGYAVERAGVGVMLDRLDDPDLLAKTVGDVLRDPGPQQAAASRLRDETRALPSAHAVADHLVSRFTRLGGR